MEIGYRMMNCCGLTELVGMNTGEHFRPSEIFKYICLQFYYASYQKEPELTKRRAGKAAFVLSYAYYKTVPKTGAALTVGTKEECDRRTELLQKYIKENDLGQLIVAPDSGNPNYGGEHIIRTFLFVPNHDGMFKFVKNNKLKGANTRDYWA